MFLPLANSPLPMPSIGAIGARPCWHQLEHASHSAWFIVRSLTENAGGWTTLLFAFEADVIAHLASCNEAPTFLICVTAEIDPARKNFGAVPVAEVWQAEDRYAADEPCIMFLGHDGVQYSGRRCCRREGLRRVRLVAKLDTAFAGWR